MHEIPIPIAEVIDFLLLGISKVVCQDIIFEHRAQHMLLDTNKFLKLFVQLCIGYAANTSIWSLGDMSYFKPFSKSLFKCLAD